MATFITSKAVGQTMSIRVYSTIGYWKYNHNGVDSNPYPNQHQDVSIPVENSNGEFTLLSCDSQGNISGEINSITLYSGYGNPSNQITSFDGSGLSSSLTYLDLSSNLLTSFSGTGLSGLTNLHLYNNLLTSFSGVGLVNLTSLELNKNNLTSFNGTGLSSLVMLYISDNNLTSFNGTGMNNLTGLYITGNPISTFTPSSITRSSNDSILSFLNSNNISNGVLYTYGGRTTTSTSNYNSLISKGWSLYGVDLPLISTFITSKSVGESFTISGYNVPFSNNRKSIQTTTGYWKYYHNGVYSNVFGDSYSNTSQTITVANSNGEFKFISCDSSGTPSGNITHLILPSCQITSFDGSDLTGLINLQLMSNSISSFNNLVFPPSLLYLGLTDNPLTSFNGTGLVNLDELQINACSLTSFNGTDLGNLTILGLQYNQLTSINLTGLTSLVNLGLKGNQLTSLDISGLTNLNALYISENPITRSINDSILDVLNSNSVNGGTLVSENGRTSAGTSDYNSLISRGWSLTGVDLPPMVTLTTSKTVGETIKIDVYTTGGYWKYNHNGIDSSLYQDGSQTITILNSNGEFSVTAYNSLGEVYGGIRDLDLEEPGVGNKITSINVVGLTTLTGLNLYNNLLTTFDGTGLSSLNSLSLGKNLLTSFSSTGLSSLNSLSLKQNQLTSFTGNGLTNLTNLNLENNPITSFNKGTGLSNLSSLHLNDNQLTSFTGTGLTNLSYLHLRNNLLTSFDGTDLFKLDILQLNGNPLVSFISGDMEFFYRKISFNGWNGWNISTLQTFDGSGLSSLAELDISNTQITSFNGTGLTSLTNLNLSNNQLTSFTNGNGLGLLTGLNLSDNSLSTFNASGMSNLTQLYLNDNQLTSFSGSNLSSLIILYLNNNQLSTFNASGMSNLTQLYLNDNQLTSFSGSNLSSLITSHIHNNQLSSFNCTGMSNLNLLWLHNNVLTSFNSGSITSLDNLILSENQLTSFDATGMTNLTYLNLSNNLISSFTGLASLTSISNLYLDDYEGVDNNPITTSINNEILDKLNSNSVDDGTFISINGRTSVGTADYNSLISRGWTLIGLDLVTPPTPPPPVPTRVGIRGNWGGSIWNEPSEPGDYTPNPISENGNWNGGSNGTSGSGGTI